MTEPLGTLFRYKLLIALVAVLMGAAAYVVTSRQPAQFQATSKLLVNQSPAAGLSTFASTPTITDPTALERLTSTQIHLAQIPAVASAALRDAGISDLSPAQLLGSVSLSEEPNSDLVDVSVTASSPEAATRLSTAFANAFAAYQAGLVTVQLSRELSGVQTTIAGAQREAGAHQARLTNSYSFQQLMTLRYDLAAALAAAPRSSVLASAAASATQTAPKPARNTGLALVLGLLVGCGLAWLLDARDRRARSVNEITATLGLNLLARIPGPPRRWRRRPDTPLTMLSDPASLEAEAIKMLQANLEFARLQSPAQIVLFTSAVGQEGKSSTVANLAVSLAQSGRRVVLVDADLRQPTLSRLFDVPDQPGLAELARGHVPPERTPDLLAAVGLDAALTPASVRGSLRLLPAGRREGQPDRLLSSHALPEVLNALRADSDWILIDTPPSTKFYDALIISQHVDAVVAVTRVWYVPRSTLAEFGRLLALAPVLSLGYVATGVRPTGDARYELAPAPIDRRPPVAPTAFADRRPPAASAASTHRGAPIAATEPDDRLPDVARPASRR